MVKIIAHRGLSELYPENTLLAFEKAIEAGADGIETDLRLTADGEIVLFHDKSLKRITQNNDSSIESMTLSALQGLDFRGGSSIVTLDVLIDLASEKLTLILEIKFHPKTYIQLCDLLLKKIDGHQSWIEISCFNDRVLSYIHRANTKIKLHKLIESDTVLSDVKLRDKYVFVEYFDIDVALHKKTLALGLIEDFKVIFWTVGNEDISTEKNAGLYGIMVNNILAYKGKHK